MGRVSVLGFSCLAAAGCVGGEGAPVRSAAHATSGELAEAGAAAPDAIGVELTELGDDVRAFAPASGRYALDERWMQFSQCSQSWADFAAHGRLVVELADDGSARACRSLAQRHTDPDATFSHRERVGFRGAWSRDGVWIDVAVEPSDADAACARMRDPPAPALAPARWHLRCTEARPGPGHATLTAPVLACRFVERAYTEELGYKTYRALPGEWVVLGPGDGLAITERDDGLQALGPETFQLTRATAPVDPTIVPSVP